MLQRRALEKYHSGGLWANTCCSHPLKGEDREETIHFRLLEEMGFDCELKPLFEFIYRAEFDNGLTEYELDQVYIGLLRTNDQARIPWRSASGRGWTSKH
jgi:isopentenyl-diphosphate delta-isomerase